MWPMFRGSKDLNYFGQPLRPKLGGSSTPAGPTRPPMRVGEMAMGPETATPPMIQNNPGSR